MTVQKFLIKMMTSCSRALKELNEHKILCKDWPSFVTELDKKNILLSPFCGAIECEDQIKTDSTR